MKQKILLRAAAVLMLLHTIGHSMAAFTWKDAPNSAVRQVIDGMLANHYDFMGRQVSMGDFYMGFIIIMIGVLLLISVVLWLLSNDTVGALSGQLRTVLAIFLLVLAVIEYIYFFPLPAVLSLLAGICTLSTVLKTSKKST
jgi:hypothetical protein